MVGRSAAGSGGRKVRDAFDGLCTLACPDCCVSLALRAVWLLFDLCDATGERRRIANEPVTSSLLFSPPSSFSPLKATVYMIKICLSISVALGLGITISFTLTLLCKLHRYKNHQHKVENQTIHHIRRSIQKYCVESVQSRLL